MQPTLSHILARTRQFRRWHEHERHQPGVSPSRLLRLHALILRAQRRLTELVEPAALPPSPLRATRRGTGISHAV